MKARFINESMNYSPEVNAKVQEKIDIAQRATEKWDHKYYNEVLEKIKGWETGERPLTFKNHILVQGAEETDKFDIFSGNNSSKVAKVLGKIIQKYKNYEVADDSVGAAPNSATFRASVSGKLWGIVNDYLRSGYYGSDQNFIIGVKIGGGIPLEIKRKIKDEVYLAIFPYDQYNSLDGGVSIGSSEGTNYDTIGLVCSKYSFNKDHAESLRSMMQK